MARPAHQRRRARPTLTVRLARSSQSPARLARSPPSLPMTSPTASRLLATMAPTVIVTRLFQFLNTTRMMGVWIVGYDCRPAWRSVSGRQLLSDRCHVPAGDHSLFTFATSARQPACPPALHHVTPCSIIHTSARLVQQPTHPPQAPAASPLARCAPLFHKHEHTQSRTQPFACLVLLVVLRSVLVSGKPSDLLPSTRQASGGSLSNNEQPRHSSH
jgi:hypothetical protein